MTQCPLAPHRHREVKEAEILVAYSDRVGSDYHRLPSSNSEEDEEDNSVREFIPSIGSLKDHEAKRADRAKRYARIWRDSPKFSPGDGPVGSPIRRKRMHGL